MLTSGAFNRSLLLFIIGSLISACSPQSAQHAPLGTHETQGIINSEKVTPKMKDPVAPLIVRLQLETHDAKAKKIYASSCSGVLIFPDVVLTAAHCIAEAKALPSASSSIHKFAKDETYPALTVTSYNKKVKRRATLAITHSEYKSRSSSRYNDLALVFLSSPFYKNWSGLPDLKFDGKGIIGPGAIVTAYGYGAHKISIDEKGERNLKEDGLRRKIFKVVSSKEADPGLWRFDDVIYLSNVPSQSEGSVCNGDSGGAAFANVNGNYILVGVTSYALFSCKSDGALISLREHITWVQNTVLQGYAIGF